MNSVQASESLGPRAAANPGGLLEWFWRGNALRTAKAAPKTSSIRRERLRRARLAAELADRTIDPAEPLRDGSALPLAITLFREAAFWVLLAGREDIQQGTTPSMRELLEGKSAGQFGFSDADFTLVTHVLADKTFVETAEERTEVLCKQADLCQAFVHGLVQSELDASDRVTTVLVQRWVRVGASAIVLATALFLGFGAVQRALQGPDLALGKPWRASSKAFDCHPKDMECGGARSAMFFHTSEEQDPWVEIDLGAPQSFSRVEVINREDCCIERVAPLVIEVSDDRTTWRELARNTETFRSWETTFKPTTARYVRARVARRSTLHLVRLSVRAH